jgi:hypothetical protein
MKVLALLLAFDKPPEKTAKSLLNQTLKPDIVVVAAYPSALRGLSLKGVVVKPDLSQCVGERVTKAINVVLKDIKLNEYDYLLKADDDVIFPKEFLEKNIYAKYDVQGRGNGLLIRVKPFIHLFGGKFPELCNDDYYLVNVFGAHGYKILLFKWCYPAIVLQEPRYSYKRLLKMGEDLYRMNCFLVPFLIGFLMAIIKRNFMQIFQLVGYFSGLLKGLEKLPESNRIFWYQYDLFIKGLRKLLKR